MTNEMIIWRERCRLMEAGKIGTTGRAVTVRTADGDTVVMSEPEQLHTYAGWRSLGRQVRKGEKAVTKIRIWKHTVRKKRGSKDPEERMIMTDAYLFKKSQTEPIADR